MGRNLRAQLEYSIKNNMAIGESKHSAKGKSLAYENNKNGKIYSYSTLHSRQDVARNFCNFVKREYGIKNACELKQEYAQAFLNEVCERGATDATLRTYKSQLNAIEKNVNTTFKTANIRLSGAIVPRNGGSAKIRCNPMKIEHLKLLKDSYKSYSTGQNAVKIGEIGGLRASEICNLRNENVVIHDTNKAEILVKNGKGGRDRRIEVNNPQQVQTLKDLKEHLGNNPITRICPIKPDSLERNLERHMLKTVDKLGIPLKNYYPNQSFHSIRKYFAQAKYDTCRNHGLSIKDSLKAVSVALGHDRISADLMNRYVANQW